MKAVDLFEKLGYKQVRNDDDYTIYIKYIEDEDISIEVSFIDQLESFTVSYINIRNRQFPFIDINLFKAIRQQLIELGWL